MTRKGAHLANFVCALRNMATFHFSVSTIRRSVGQSAVAAAAYRGACSLRDQRTGLTHDFGRKRGCVAGGFVGWDGDREALWNAAEAVEKRKNAVSAREITVALPCELDDASRRRIVERFAADLHGRHGVAVCWDIHRAHRKGDERNHHAHLLITTRRVDEGRFLEKTRELDTKPSSSEHMVAWREAWSGYVNQELEEAGLASRVNHRSLKSRAEEGDAPLVAMEKMGPATTAMERRGINTDKGDRNRRKARVNRIIKKLHERSMKLLASINEIQVAKAIAEVRRVSEETPLPVPCRKPAYEALFAAGCHAWGGSWPRSLAKAIAGTWPLGLRTVAFVTRKLFVAATGDPTIRGVGPFLSIIETALLPFGRDMERER